MSGRDHDRRSTGKPFVPLLGARPPRSAAAISHEVEALRRELLDLQVAFQKLTDFGQRARLEQQVLALRSEFEAKLLQYMQEAGRSHEELVLTHQLLRVLADTLEDAVFIKDRQSRFLLCNQVCAELLGGSSESLVGTTGAQCLPPETLAAVLADDRQVMERGERHQYVQSVLMPGGRRRRFLTTKIPFRDPAGKVAGLLGVSRCLDG